MNKSTRIARATFDIVFLLLLLLPILAYLLLCMNEAQVLQDYDFNAFVVDNFPYSEQIENVINQVVSCFDNVGQSASLCAYFSYVVTVTIAYVFVHILCFVPKLCLKLLKGWV